MIFRVVYGELITFGERTQNGTECKHGKHNLLNSHGNLIVIYLHKMKLVRKSEWKTQWNFPPENWQILALGKHEKCTIEYNLLKSSKSHHCRSQYRRHGGSSVGSTMKEICLCSMRPTKKCGKSKKVRKGEDEDFVVQRHEIQLQVVRIDFFLASFFLLAAWLCLIVSFLLLSLCAVYRGSRWTRFPTHFRFFF